MMRRYKYNSHPSQTYSQMNSWETITIRFLWWLIHHKRTPGLIRRWNQMPMEYHQETAQDQEECEVSILIAPESDGTRWPPLPETATLRWRRWTRHNHRFVLILHTAQAECFGPSCRNVCRYRRPAQASRIFWRPGFNILSPSSDHII
jgi:hypothetical protein